MKKVTPFIFSLVTVLIWYSILRCRAQTFEKSVQVKIIVDGQAEGTPLKHVWQYFGYDECNFTYSRGSQALMKDLARTQPEPVYLRTHFLLNSGDGTPELKWGSSNVYTEDNDGKPVYDWKIMDEIMDATVNSNCRPLVEIGFMPQALSSRPKPYRNSETFRLDGGCFYPPDDYGKWAGLIREWVKHSAGRYPDVEKNWIWELWNEPNIGYWQGTLEEYCKLFDYTEAAVHEVLPAATFGGPHTAGAPNFLREFLRYCSSGTNHISGAKGTRLDYISFHSKGRTSMEDGQPRMDLGRNLRTINQGFSIVHEFPQYHKTPIIIGECDPEGLAALSARQHRPNIYRNLSTYAAYEIAMIKHTIDLAEGIGVNLQGVLTWAFMFDGKDYFEGFRTLATNGIHKPVLNGFKMLGMLRGERIPLHSSGTLGVEAILKGDLRERTDIDGLAVRNDGGMQILLWNYHDNIVAGTPAAVTLSVKAPDQKSTRAQIVHYRIDEDHSNAYSVWLGMGSPQSPTASQIETLKAAGQLELLEPIYFADVVDGKLELNFSLPRFAVSLVEIDWGK